MQKQNFLLHKEMFEAYQQRVLEFKDEKYINYP